MAVARRSAQSRDHFVQFYDDDSALLGSVVAFIGGALALGGAAFVVATAAHRASLEQLLAAQGVDLEEARRAGRYAAFDADERLAAMLVEGWPDEQRFVEQWEGTIADAVKRFPSVAIFAEMVELLWRDGRHAAAVHLEHLWNTLASRHAFALFCAYPMADVALGPAEAMASVCAEHTYAVPTESYTAIQKEGLRLAEVCKLQQKAQMLEREVRRRKRIEHTLAAREKELSDFLENAPHAIHCVDAAGRILWANQFELDLLGYAPSEYIGQNIAEFHVDAAELARIMKRLREGRALTEEPVQLRCKDGSIRNVLITSNVRWENGAFVHARCFMRDVTDERRALERMRAAEERADESRALLAAIVESSDDAIVSKSLDSRIRSWNSGAARLFGYTAEEVVGKPITIIIPPELQHEEQKILARIGMGERVEHFETVRVAKDGRRIDVSVTVSPILDRHGRVIGASNASRDITERKRAEEDLRVADRRKDEFLAMLGHELRNPLAPIRNVTELLRRRTAGRDPAHERLCAMLERQVQQMSRLLDDLLDVSRISQGKIRFEQETIDFQVAIARAVEASGPFIERRRHALTVSVPQGELPVLGDMARLVQMLTNLLNNAAKYTPEGGAIALTAERSGAFVEIRVKDNGAGIPAEMLPRVFDLFVQVDPALRQSQEGMGIGLALVRSIVEHHAGSVRARSAGLGQGSEFCVRLPLVAEPVATRTSASPDAASAAPRKRRILLVDDNRDLAESLAALLELSGHEVTLAGDGPTALRSADSAHPDLALIDIGLPVMNGYEIARRLRAGGCEAKLVAVTGYGGREERDRSLAAGFDDYFVKPIDPAALDRLIAARGEAEPTAASD